MPTSRLLVEDLIACPHPCGVVLKRGCSEFFPVLRCCVPSGSSAIAAVGGLVAWVRLRTEPDYSSIVSARYVQDPVLLTLVAIAICIAIATTLDMDGT
eukprot:4418718-Amphidinium_carterae.2